MTRQKVIDELFDIRTVLDCCFAVPPDDCEPCPGRSVCGRFGASEYEYALEVIDTAIEMLKDE